VVRKARRAGEDRRGRRDAVLLSDVPGLALAGR
jgi:hypothetical protein